MGKYEGVFQSAAEAHHNAFLGNNQYGLVLGVVLDVMCADHPSNISCMSTNGSKGYLHTCTVLVIQDTIGTYTILDNVVITPDHSGGIDDYYERLPRASTALVSNQSWNDQLQDIDPYDLDGDWCIVGFLGGVLDAPFVVRWWPHPRNVFDPQTSGTPVDEEATSNYLEQRGRYLHRVNGVETTVTYGGDVYVNTNLSGGTVSLGRELVPENGRIPRTVPEESGGSVSLWIKPSQLLELSWEPPRDGVGYSGIPDTAIPQENPRTTKADTTSERGENTYVVVDNSHAYWYTPSYFKIEADATILESSDTVQVRGDSTSFEAKTFTVQASDHISAKADTSITLEATTELNMSATVSAGITSDGTLNLKSTGPASFASDSVATIAANGTLSISGASLIIGASSASIGSTGSMVVHEGGVNIGNGSLGGAVGGDQLIAAVNAFSTAVAAAATTAVDSAFASAVASAAQTMAATVAASVSTTVRIG